MGLTGRVREGMRAERGFLHSKGFFARPEEGFFLGFAGGAGAAAAPWVVRCRAAQEMHLRIKRRERRQRWTECTERPRLIHTRRVVLYGAAG